MGVFSNEISQLFTQEESVISIIEDTIWVLLIYISFDTIHGVQSGIIRGLGLQGYGSLYTLISYYGIGMPLALYLAFSKNMELQGLWLGFAIACVALDTGFTFIIMCPNWTKIAEKMRENLDNGKAVRTSEVESYRNYKKSIISRRET